MLDQTAALMRQQMLDRVRPNTSYTPEMRMQVNAAFDILDRFEAEQVRISKDGNLSEVGKRAALASKVVERLAPALADGAAKRARHAAQHNASHRVAIGKPDFDKSDMAAGLERREVRDYLRGLPDDKRMQAAFEFATDKKMAQAMLSGPSARMTGLSEDIYKRVQETYLQHFHGDELAKVEALQGDIDALAAAVQIVWTKLRTASNMSVGDFTQFWAGLELAADKS